MTLTDPNADAFMRRILADPDDPVPRLVFADWLEESASSSNLAWARYLRLADELANLPADDPRRPKMAAHLDRIGGLVRARLTYRAEVFCAYPDAVRRVLPYRCMALNLDAVTVPDPVARVVPESVARENTLLPIAELAGRGLAVAAPVPFNHRVLELLHYILNRPIVSVEAPADQILAAIDRHHRATEYEVLGSPLFLADTAETFAERTPLALWAVDEDEPVIRLVHLILSEALDLRAAAVELEPLPDRLQVWHHAGGQRREWDARPVRLARPLADRFRVMAGLPLVSFQAVETGEVRLDYRGQRLRLPVRITATALGPAVHVTIPPAVPGHPAAVNPAA